MSTFAAPRHCENCAAPLLGEFCHQCGQSVHNPIRHTGHAIEEFFEAFWHLDGRVFRTLRELPSPGRVAIRYLAGHRQRYIAPLRLFVILSLLTFFIGRLTIHVEADPVAGTGAGSISNSQTVEGVRRNREAGAPVTTPPEPGLVVFGEDADGWDPKADPVAIGWLPDVANAWVNRKLVHGKDNIERMKGRSDLWLQAFLGSVPSALFVLVPVFALMLKLAYVFKRRLYLEHLVVALYSHAFLLVALAAIFLLGALSGWAEPRLPWLSQGSDFAVAGLLLWMPAYLLLMQKRVYGQGWPMTTLKYLVVGLVYFVLLAFATTIMFLASLVRT